MVIPFKNTFLKLRLSVILFLRNTRDDSSANAYVKEGYPKCPHCDINILYITAIEAQGRHLYLPLQTVCQGHMEWLNTLEVHLNYIMISNKKNLHKIVSLWMSCLIAVFSWFAGFFSSTMITLWQYCTYVGKEMVYKFFLASSVLVQYHGVSTLMETEANVMWKLFILFQVIHSILVSSPPLPPLPP